MKQPTTMHIEYTEWLAEKYPELGQFGTVGVVSVALRHYKEFTQDAARKAFRKERAKERAERAIREAQALLASLDDQASDLVVTERPEPDDADDTVRIETEPSNVYDIKQALADEPEEDVDGFVKVEPDESGVVSLNLADMGFTDDDLDF